MDPITPLNASIPTIIENVVAKSVDKDYFNELGAAKSEKIRAMTSELLESMMGYLKYASLAHALTEMKEFQQATPSEDLGVELKALWADIIDEAITANPLSRNLLRQVCEVFNRLITESSSKTNK